MPLRFALNMAVAAADTPVQKMIDARVPSFLVGMLSGDNDVVRGEQGRGAGPVVWGITLHHACIVNRCTFWPGAWAVGHCARPPLPPRRCEGQSALVSQGPAPKGGCTWQLAGSAPLPH